MYKGIAPYTEAVFNRVFNKANDRFTHEDYKMLGETMFKGFHGMLGANWELLENVRQMGGQPAGRFDARQAAIGAEEDKEDPHLPIAGFFDKALKKARAMDVKNEQM